MDELSRNDSILRHILQHCEKISTLQERFGKDITVFLSDIAYYDSVFMNLLQIGELANRLPKKFQEAHGDIPWRQIIDLRNVIVHGYGTVKSSLLWKTICDDVPDLHSRVLGILSGLLEHGGV
jgi:uncharacterized protein with HEPN domain